MSNEKCRIIRHQLPGKFLQVTLQKEKELGVSLLFSSHIREGTFFIEEGLGGGGDGPGLQRGESLVIILQIGEGCKLISNVYSISNMFSVLCLWALSIVRLLNLVCAIVERSHVFSLRAEEKDLSPAALVAGFKRSSLHMVMISLIILFPVSESCLILAKMSSKQVNSPSFINTLKMSS